MGGEGQDHWDSTADDTGVEGWDHWVHCHCTLSGAVVHAVCSHFGKQGTIGDGPLGDLVALAGAVAIAAPG